MARQLFGLLIFSILTHVASQEWPTCKCDGHYATGRPVSGCIQGICYANTSDSTRCVTIYRASQPNTIIGNDCVSWPRDSPSECATYDDGSRLCVDSFCQKPEAKNTKECQLSEDPNHVRVDVHVNHAGLKFLLDTLGKHAIDEVSNLKIPDQTLIQSGVDITIMNIQIDKFVPPVFAYVLEPPSSIKIRATGGDFKVCANWKAHLTIATFLGSDGNFCAWSLNQKGVNASLRVIPSVNQAGKILLKTGLCNFEMPVDLLFKGSLGANIANLAKDTIGKRIEKEASGQFCRLVGGALEMLLQKIPMEIKLDERFRLEYQVGSVLIDQNGVRIQAAVNANDTDIMSG